MLVGWHPFSDQELENPKIKRVAPRTPMERVPGPSGLPKKEFSRMILERNIPWGSVLKKVLSKS